MSGRELTALCVAVLEKKRIPPTDTAIMILLREVDDISLLKRMGTQEGLAQ